MGAHYFSAGVPKDVFPCYLWGRALLALGQWKHFRLMSSCVVYGRVCLLENRVIQAEKRLL